MCWCTKLAKQTEIGHIDKFCYGYNTKDIRSAADVEKALIYIDKFHRQESSPLREGKKT